MKAEEIKKILIENKFKANSNADHVWSFNETTIKNNNLPLVQYSLYEEDENVYLKHNNAIEINEDYLMEIKEKQPVKIILTPKFTKNRTIIFEAI